MLLAVGASAAILGCADRAPTRATPPVSGPSIGSPAQITVVPAASDSGSRQSAEIAESHSARRQPIDYFPLAVGNHWEYRAVYRVASRVSLEATAALTIEGIERQQGHNYFKAVCRVEGILHNPTTTSYYRRAAEGVLQFDPAFADAPESVLLPESLQPGAKWVTAVRDDVFFGRVVANQVAYQEPITECGDTIYKNCMRISSDIESKIGKVHQDQWLAPGVGVIRQSQQGPFWSMESSLTTFRKGEQ